jgi:hypothetical protein
MVGLRSKLPSCALGLAVFLDASRRAHTIHWLDHLAIDDRCGRVNRFAVSSFQLEAAPWKSWPKYAIALALTPIPVAMLVERLSRAIIGYGISQ